MNVAPPVRNAVVRNGGHMLRQSVDFDATADKVDSLRRAELGLVEVWVLRNEVLLDL